MNSKEKCSFTPFSTFNSQPILLPLIFALADFFEHGETGLFRVRDGQRLKLVWRTEIGKDFEHRLFACRTICERLGRKWTVQREFPAADLAVAFTQFVFVERHELNFKFCLSHNKWNSYCTAI
jgi:hypothetical protein